MISCLQLNVNNCRAAQQLLLHNAALWETDVLLISECSQDGLPGRAFRDPTGRAALVVRDSGAAHGPAILADGIVGCSVSGVLLISVYVSPNSGREAFERFLSDLHIIITRGGPRVVVGGDFNAKAKVWGSIRDDARGSRLLDTMASCDMHLANRGGEPTFLRGHQRSWLDITWMTTTLITRVTDWRVLPDEFLSDHRAIRFSIQSDETPRINIPKLRWAWRSISDEQKQELSRLMGAVDTDNPRAFASHLRAALQTACSAFLRRRGTGGRRPIYWWCEEIAEARRGCVARRRALFRASADNRDERLEALREARRLLGREIRRSKTRCWKELCQMVDTDPWGTPYKIVAGKLRSRSDRAPPHLALEAATTLFPRGAQDDRHVPIFEEGAVEETPLITREEVLTAAASLPRAKAPGPDGVPNEMVREAVFASPETFVAGFNSCLNLGVFPREWKEASLVLIRKPGKDGSEASHYRPISLLDGIGKVLEKILKLRIETVLEASGGLSERQYGFRRRKSTLDAMERVVEVAKRAMRGPRRTRGFCALVTLDVKNAFNTIPWGVIARSLTGKGIGVKIQRLLVNYLGERLLLVDTPEGERRIDVRCGVAQGSVLGPTLWNLAYDGVLRLPLPEGAELVGFADDLGLVATARTVEQLEAKCNDCVARVCEWLERHGLELAPAKTELVVFRGKRRIDQLQLRVGGVVIEPSEAVKYLGLWLDRSMSFGYHVRKKTERATAVIGALSRILPNTGGAGQGRRHLLQRAVESTLLYAAPVWRKAFEVGRYRDMVGRVHRRGALRVAAAYRTVSADAIYVIAGIAPADLIAERLHRIRQRVETEPHEEIVRKADEELQTEWLRRWTTSPHGAWTRRLIPDIRPWLNRSFGEIDYHLTQFLSGHGVFRAYLHRFHLIERAECWMCESGEADTAEHAVFICTSHDLIRASTWAQVGIQTPETIIAAMIGNEESWRAINGFVHHVIKRREETERRNVRDQRRRQRDARNTT